jgi:hypothetical protein
MTDLNAKRCRLGNGHRMWLKNASPPWAFAKDIGSAWEEVQKDPSTEQLVQAVLKWREFDVVSNRLVCEDMKAYFKQEAIDPRDLSLEGAWMWLAHYIIGVRVGQSYLMGSPPPRGREMRQLRNAGAMNANCFYANYNVWDHGSQTFSFSLPLAAKLMLTDIGHVKWADFKMPFPAFVIQVPPELATLVDPSTGQHRMDSVLVVDGYSSGRRRIEMLFTGQENENSTSMGDDANIYANMWCNSEDHLVEDAIKYNRGDFVDDNQELAIFAGTTGDDATKQLMRWACAMILYLTDFPKDIVKETNPEVARINAKLPTLKGKARHNAKRKVNALLKEPTPYLVGTKVTIDPRLEKVAAQIGRGERLPPSVASYVRGHRKMQPHGPGRTLRKPIWVDPYWRNLEHEQVSSKTYEVK